MEKYFCNYHSDFSFSLCFLSSCFQAGFSESYVNCENLPHKTGTFDCILAKHTHTMSKVGVEILIIRLSTWQRHTGLSPSHCSVSDSEDTDCVSVNHMFRHHRWPSWSAASTNNHHVWLSSSSATQGDAEHRQMYMI